MDPIDPKTRALEAYIEASVGKVLSKDTAASDGLLVLSAWQEAMPALVHLDPVLEPVDSRVFAVLWLWAKQQGRGALAFPSYDYLLTHCNIHARATVSRALAILRLTRWITLCRRVHERGRNRGNIYALHDEPLAMEATCYLDKHYLDFIAHACTNSHARVSDVAKALRGSVSSTPETTSPVAGLNCRLEAIQTVASGGRGSYFGLRPSALTRLQPKPPLPRLPKDIVPATDGQLSGENTSLAHPVQNLNSDRVQILNSARSSCSSSLKKTTTTEKPDCEEAAGTEKTSPALIFPPSLSPRECTLARRYLQAMEPESQQALLDELGEKILVQAKQACRVRNPLSLLIWMCRAHQEGRPVLTSGHLRHRERREREQAIEAKTKAEADRLTALAKAQLTAKSGKQSF